MEVLEEEPFDLVVPVEEVMHGPGSNLISDVRAFDDATAVVAVVDTAECGRRALAAGAYDIFPRPSTANVSPSSSDHIGETSRLRERSAVLDRMVNGGAHIGALLTRDPHMIAVVDVIRRLRALSHSGHDRR